MKTAAILFFMSLFLVAAPLVSSAQLRSGTETSVTAFENRANLAAANYFNAWLYDQFHPNGLKASLRNNSSNVSYLVELKDSTTCKVSSKIIVDDYNNSYLVLEDESRKRHDSLRYQFLVPSDTRSIQKVALDGTILAEGFPLGTSWLFPIAKGNICAYGFFPSPSRPSSMHYNFIQKAGGPILPLTTQLLMEMLGEHEKASNLAEAEKYHEAITLYNKQAKKALEAV
jgi:hypothetical protein